jgi:MarR family transcriptional regulator, transcriptional regulator for hemolysin
MPKREPVSSAHSLGRQVNHAARAMRAVLDARLATAGTNFATWTVLFVLDAEGPIIQRELAARLEVEGPTLVRRIDQLESEGLVSRKESPGDRRATLVALTDEGRALFKRVRHAVSEIQAELVSGLAPEDVATTLRVLRYLTEKCRGLTKAR